MVAPGRSITTFTRKVWLWLIAFYKWLAEMFVAWLALLVVAVALLFSLRSGTTEPQVRITGMVLQWFGIVTVAHGLHQTRKLFGRPNITAVCWEWISRFPRWHRGIILEATAASPGLAGLTARAIGWSKIDPCASAEAQINALRQNVERLNYGEQPTRGLPHGQGVGGLEAAVHGAAVRPSAAGPPTSSCGAFGEAGRRVRAGRDAPACWD
jgi:hypothetical protein